MKRHMNGFSLAIAVLALAAGCVQTPTREPSGGFQVDTSWPKPLPNNWILGQVAGVAVDARDHVWIIQRPKTLVDEEKGAAFNPPRAKCCVPAPAVIEFDIDGSVLRAWGGPGPGYEWPENEHGIYVDHDGNVWIGGNDPKDNQILKFTPDGKFLMQIGHAGASEGSNSKTQLGRPAHMEIDAQANELYVADGYGNKRVIVFDATTGAYKRHWGAYGKPPSDEKLPMHDPNSPQFTNPVHCVRLAKDGLLYVCDRANNRVQVFRKDGTFVKQFVFEENTLASGSSWDLVLSTDPEQKYFYLADGTNDEVRTVERESGKVVASFGRPGRFAGEFLYVHNIGIDSKGNLYATEVASGKRVQKFRPVN
jgi:DNA-binding beta-propeller fold protein YncE